MKQTLVFLSLIFLSLTVVVGQENNTNKTKSKAPHMEFSEIEYNFGKVEQNSPAIHKFQYKNTGKEILLITKVKSSCGCTTPTYTREPVKKNKIGVIEVKYNSRIVGKFSKSVTVTSNADNSPIVLRIKGEVEKAPATAN